MTIYETTPGGLYPQPGRKVTRFPSGRIRVDQTYVCAEANVDKITSLTTSGGPVTSGGTTIADATYLPLTSESFFNAASGIVIFKSGSSWSLESSSGSWTGGTATDPSGTYTPSGDAVGSFTVSANTIRSTLAIGKPMPDGDSSPSIDGLAIFPTPDENRRGDGFTDFNVSAYGRASSELSGIQLTPVTVTYANALKYKVYNIAGSITIPSGTVLEYADLNLDSSPIDPFDFETVSGLNLILDALIIDEGTKGEINDAGAMITRDFKLWQIRITNDGISPAYTFNVMIFPPSVSVKSYKNFGAFTEVEIETVIESSTTQITA